MQFSKYHGLGNDFIFIDDFKGVLVPRGEMLAKALCHRQFGIGADGLVLVTKPNDLYIMRIFNADGTEAEMCGNAIRCMADYLLQAGLETGPILHIATLSGTKEIRVSGNSYVVDLGEPDFSYATSEVKLSLSGHTWTAYPVSMGNPHAVVFMTDVDDLDIAFWGPLLERDEAWPAGANIDFTQVLSPSRLKVRVWERGAGATLACGTGASAAAVVAKKRGLVEGPIQVSLPGGDLTIDWGPSWGRENRVYMTGPATKVFTGKIDLDATKKGR